MPQQVVRNFINDQTPFGARYKITPKKMAAARVFRPEKSPIIIEQISLYVAEINGLEEFQVAVFSNRLQKTEPRPEVLLSKVATANMPSTPYNGWWTLNIPACELQDPSCWIVVWFKGAGGKLELAAPADKSESEIGYSQIKEAASTTTEITEEPGQFSTSPTGSMYGPFGFVLGGPRPTPPPTPALREIQPEHLTLLARWKLGDLVKPNALVSAAYEDAGSIAMEAYVFGQGPTKGCPGMNFNDDSYSSMGNIVSSKKQYFQARPEEKPGKEPFKLFGGVTIEGLTCAEPNGASFLLFGNNQCRCVIEGKNILFTIWAETTEAATTLTATNVLKGYPQLVDCTYEPSAGLLRIWVDAVLVAETTITPVNLLQSFAEANINRKVTGTATSGKKTVTAVAAKDIIGMGQHWNAPATAPQRGFTTGNGLEVVSETSFEMTQSATESGAMTFTVAYPATLLMPLAFAGSCEAVGQDIAVYGAPLSKAEIEARFKAFRQINTDARRL